MSAQRSIWALATLVALGCAGERTSAAPRRAVFPRSAAAGRPATCPDGAVDPGIQGPSPLAVRCSYDDAVGGRLVRVHGRALQEPPQAGLGTPVADASFEVREVAPGGEPGRLVAEGSTDRDGAFSFGAVLSVGSYEIVLRPSEGTPIRRPFEIAADTRELDLPLWLPRRS
jgi:hypothetical protein